MDTHQYNFSTYGRVNAEVRVLYIFGHYRVRDHVRAMDIVSYLESNQVVCLLCR